MKFDTKGYSIDYIEVDGVRYDLRDELVSGYRAISGRPYIAVVWGSTLKAYWDGMEAYMGGMTQHVLKMKDGGYFKTPQKWRADMTAEHKLGIYLGAVTLGN